MFCRTTTPSLHRFYPRADCGQRALELGVGLELVAEAALQPAAHARELRGVERQSLFLGHLDGDRLELLQPRRAAELPAAGTDTSRRLGLVARADRLHVHARVEELAELVDEAPEVHAIFRDAEEGDLAAVEGAFGLDELDGQRASTNQIESDTVVPPLALEVLVLAGEVARVGLLDDSLQRADRRARAGRDHDEPQRGTTLRLHQHAIVPLEDERPRIEVIDPPSWPEADADREGVRVYGLLVHERLPS